MEFFQILAACGDEALLTILSVVRSAINLVTFAIPIILIVLGVVDLSKAVIASDEKKTKEAQKMFTTRLIYAVVIFLIPTIITLLFNLLDNPVFSSEVDGYTWVDCWRDAGK